ncbi:Sodium/potassium-transporting ATPase subunit alpha-2 [Toxocara canis]|uniref:Sodium/potassium-transporting ATPase subunit alpha-2 n=1 Tax=Toxocara canis TaxID=6265 RepID=A0A0B2W5H8_TOXCA|nr:Sodium/potassium-transporting ATPase subunit alpha-2 [Toxocara canis]
MRAVRRIKRSCDLKNEVKKSGVKAGSSTDNANRNLSSLFFEHRLTLLELQMQFVDSNIFVSKPNNSGGLTSKKASDKLAKDGPNVLLPPKEMGNLELFLRQFVNLFWILLIGAGILSLVTYFFDRSVAINLYAAIVLFLIVIVMCTVTFFEEKKARNVVRGFSNLLPAKCTVIRESRQMTIDSCDIVVGDLVIVKSGSRVPADLRIIQSTGLKVEASSITGEAEPIEVHAESVAEHIGVFDAGNVTFNGSFCVDGEGIGICIRTGQATVIGQIAALTTEQKQESSSLQIEISRFVKFVTVSALIMGAIIFIIGGFINKWHDIVNLFISGFLVVIVANVPQGLPATVTSELTIIARRMASKNVYMKKLDVIESFGATTVIASDKTGTLTMNKMTVTDVWCGRNYVSGIPEVKYKTLHTITASKERSVMVGLDDFDKPLPDLITIMAICNKAEFEAVGQTIHFGDEQLTLSRRTLSKIDGGENLWRPTGRRRLHSVAPAADDLEAGGKLGRRRHSTMSVGGSKKERRICGTPSEVALLRYADSVTDVAQLRRRYRIAFEVPFNSMRKWHLTVVQDNTINENDEDNKLSYIAFLKGAPEVIMKKCSQFALADGCISIDEGTEMEFQDAYDHFGNSGRRVIGFAMKRFPFNSNMRFSSDGSDFPLEDFTFVGLVAIMDPPRPDTSDAIKRCKRAGIKVFMVTGDHPSTATAVAKEIGLIGPPKEITVQKTKRSISMSFAKDEEEDEERDWAVVHGSLLPDLTEAHWDELLETTPEQKLLIVEKCQHRGEVVTVTGDGVNDAPALKKANVGVAMGITGSDVAKQAADIVLMDDNFASIVKGVEEGRLLFDNLRKTIAYTLTHTMPEVVTIVFNFVVGVPMALTTLLILSVDLGTELAPAISLAYENAEIDIMEKAPRKRTTRLVSIAMLAYSYAIAGGMVIIGSSAAYLYTYAYHGIDLRDIFFSADDYFKHNAIGNFTSNGLVFNEEQQVEIQAQGCAAYYITMVISQAFHLWMCKTRRISIFQHGINNLVSIYAVIIEVLLVLLFVYTPGINFVMGARPPPFQVWFFAPAVGIALWIYNETRKLFIRRSPNNNVVRLFKW